MEEDWGEVLAETSLVQTDHPLVYIRGFKDGYLKCLYLDKEFFQDLNLSAAYSKGYEEGSEVRSGKDMPEWVLSITADGNVLYKKDSRA